MREIVLTEQQIADICTRLGRELTEELKNEEKFPVFIGVMNGALPFLMDLVRKVDLEFYMDFIQISSYSGTSSTGIVQLKKDISFDLQGRTAVIVEDIVDTGLSMAYLIKHVYSKNPKRVLVVSLFDKETSRKNDVKVDFAGVKDHGNQFLCGYGLDYQEIYRTTPYVFNLSPEEKAAIDDKFVKEQTEK